MTKALVPVADGSEEMEAVITVDVFRRAGWEVDMVGLHEGPVTASRGVKILPDRAWDSIDPSAYDVMALPGGNGGTENLMADERVLDALRAHCAAGRITAAVCAAPLVLQKAGLLEGIRVTCHPAAAPSLTAGEQVDDSVVVSGNIVTSRGPGTTFSFALSIVALIDGREKALELAKGMVLSTGNAT